MCSAGECGKDLKDALGAVVDGACRSRGLAPPSRHCRVSMGGGLPCLLYDRVASVVGAIVAGVDHARTRVPLSVGDSALRRGVDADALS